MDTQFSSNAKYNETGKGFSKVLGIVSISSNSFSTFDNVLKYLSSIRVSLIGFCFTFLFSVNIQAQSACNMPSNDIIDAVVQLKAENLGVSSGVVVGKNRVLTVAHGINLKRPLYIRIGDEYLLAKVLVIDEIDDLALVEVDTKSITPINLSKEVLAPNDWVWAMGYPWGKKLRTSIGVVTETKQTKVYSTAYINSGVSGGALLRCNTDGSEHFYELAGIVKAYIADVTSGEALNTGDSVAVAGAILDEIITAFEQPSDKSVAYQEVISSFKQEK